MQIDLVLVYFNNEKIISHITKHVKEISSLFNKLILVNNGSSDNTKLLLSQNFHDKNKFQIVNLKKIFI